MRDEWNILDFLIVSMGLVDLSFEDINMDALRAIRLLRTLRPLRFVSHNINMKIVVTALF